MKRLIPLILILALLFTGCSTWLDGSYDSITPHEADKTPADSGNKTVHRYSELYSALSKMVDNVTANGLLLVPDYDKAQLEADMELAIESLQMNNPIAAYALDEVRWELGTSGGQDAMAVAMTFSKAKAEILRIRKVSGMDACMGRIAEALADCDDRLVINVSRYSDTDFVQLIEDYALENPHIVMEIPKVTAICYPEEGAYRIVELTFTYENGRDRLRYMRNQVSPVFEAAVLNVSGDAAASEKFALLYAFLMERHNYTFNTSITPAYSLIRHGEGDAKAFAVVYAAMCREAGLECKVVTGTRNGEAWYWNLLSDGESWYHMDLLKCNQADGFCWHYDAEMTNYVWDYAQYPASVPVEPPVPSEPSETVPTTAPTA